MIITEYKLAGVESLRVLISTCCWPSSELLLNESILLHVYFLGIKSRGKILDSLTDSCLLSLSVFGPLV